MSDKLQAEIIEDRVREIVNLPERGQILDRNGNIIAMSLITYNIALNPNLIVSEKHQNNMAKLLSETLDDVDYEEVLEVAKGTSKYKMLVKHVTPDKAKIIRESGIGGIQISQSPRRLYPNGDLGGTFLGFVNDNNVPGAGIEIKMDSFLAGTQGYTLAEMTPFGSIIPVGSQNTVEPINGQNLHTTINSYMQHVLEQRLKQAVEEMNPDEIHVTIMDPNNGDILAMASYPSFDPNEYQESDSKTWTNTPANFSYEPGSIFKPIFMAAAFDSGVIDGTEIYPSGRYNVKGHVIGDWNRGQGWGDIDAKRIIQHSSNVGMIKIAEKMSNDQIISFLKKQGFNQPTGLELPGEEKGVNFPTEQSLVTDPIRRANISFGQGISMTPIQILTSFSELINGGYEIKPTLVDKVVDDNNNIVYETPEPTGKRSYKENTSNIMREYLRNNMEIGSGASARVEGFDGGGKTGSAWYVEDGRYAQGKIIGSFIGFMPYENPKYSVVISVKNPQSGIEYGSDAANPIFHDVMTEVVRYEGLVPTTPNADEINEDITSYDFKNFSWHLFDDAKEKIEEEYGKDVKVVKDGSGEVVIEQSYSYKDDKITIHLTTKALKEGDSYYIPSFIGMNKSKVEKLFEDHDIVQRFYGKNKVIEQNIEPGFHFKPDNLTLWLN